MPQMTSLSRLIELTVLAARQGNDPTTAASEKRLHRYESLGEGNLICYYVIAH